VTRIVEKIKIVGVDCASCIYGIERRLSKVNGLISFKADYVSGEAVIEYDSDIVTLYDVVKAIRDAGYDVEKNHINLYVEIEDEERYYIENRLRRFPGVIDCRISPVSGSMRIFYNPYTLSYEDIKQYVKQLGIEFSDVVKELKLRFYDRRYMYLRIASFVLALFSIVYHNLDVFGYRVFLWSYKDFILFSIATTVIILNIDIIIKGFKSIARLSPTMESLIALSSTSSYIFSIFITLGFIGHFETFFEASSGVLGFVGFGKYIESRLRGKVTEAIDRLSELRRGMVRVVREGFIEEISVEKVLVGDIVEFKAGERILVDGVVVDGWGYVDESMFTGEPIPRFKTSEKRDPIFAGTILVSGYIRVRVTRASKDTVLTHIIEMVKEAQFTKPKVQIIADRIVGYMTWIVIALSIVTAIYWFFIHGDLEKAVLFPASVLAVACPCPLGIAIPMVYAIAAYKVASIGLVIKRGDIFERILSINTAIFDKTGTLTYGKPVVDKVIVVNNVDEKTLMGFVCSAEARSEHPIASSIIEYCKKNGYLYNDPSEYDHVPGLGIIAKVDGVEVVVGSERLVKEMNIEISNNMNDIIMNSRLNGYTTIFVGLNRTLSGLILIKDIVRDDAKKVIDFLKKINIKTVMATGDNRETAEAIAKEIGLDEVYSELTPDDKAELIEDIQRNGIKVMFIGDGINDANALGKAFLGIAMGGGADISREAGDAIIANNKLETVKQLYYFSRKVKRKSLENLAWAFIYNLILVPIAMGFLYNIGIVLRPEMAAIAMIASDISVVLNSLTLLKIKPGI